MISALLGMLTGLIALLIILAPAIVVVILLINDNKKKKVSTQTAQVQPATTAGNNASGGSNLKPVTEPLPVNAAPPAPPIPPKPVDPFKKWNILLYIGSFLLVIAMITFINSADDSLVAPTAITLTLLFYIGGIALFKAVPYLKSVGKSFSYTASAVFPFWVISFMALGMETQSSWILASLISFVAFIVTTAIFNSKVTAFFAYIWMFILTWSCTPSYDSTTASYWAILAPMALTLVPTLLWLGKPKWLPVAFRKATQVFGYILTPAAFVVLLPTYFVDDIALDLPFLRTIVAAILLLYAILHWFKGRKYAFFVFTRFVAQMLIFAITADTLNFSFFQHLYWGYTNNETASISAIVVWLSGFLAQTLIALFIPKKDETAVKAEHVVEVISLIGILITPILAASLESAALIQMIIFAFVAILGVVYAFMHKNVAWTIATYVGLFLIPVVMPEVFEIESMNWLLVAYFTIYGLIALGGYSIFAKKQPTESFVITFVGIIIAAFVAIVASADENFVEIGWLVLAVMLTIFGYLSKKDWLYESAIYSGAFCVFSLVGTVGGAIATKNASMVEYDHQMNCAYEYNSYRTNCIPYERTPRVTEQAELAISTIRAFVIPTALLAVSFWKERKVASDIKKVRFLLGYIILTLSLLGIGWDGGGYWMLPSLIAQVAFLVYAVFKDKSWMVWTTIAMLVISMFSLSGGFTYIWFGVIGIILILIVVWRLTKLNAQKQREDAKQEKEVKEDDKKTDK